MKQLANLRLYIISLLLLSLFNSGALSEPTSQTANNQQKQYHVDALQCQQQAQISHEIKIDVGQSKEAINIPSGIDTNLYSLCMESLGHNISIDDDLFLSVNQDCHEKAKARTKVIKQDDSIMIEAPDSNWFQECYRTGGITVDVIEDDN